MSRNIRYTKHMRIIKKYPNRRLYDTETGNYITLDDVKKLVFHHIEFQVLDSRTQKDLTQSTLMQIIMEQEDSAATPIFTPALLQNFIRSYQEKSQNLFTQYLEETMSLFSKQKGIFDQQWDVYQKQVEEIRKNWRGLSVRANKSTPSDFDTPSSKDDEL